MSNHDELGVISASAAKSVMTIKEQFDRLHLDENGSVIGVDFDRSVPEGNYLKLFKGLFYHQYKHPIDKEYKIVALLTQIS